MGEPPGAGKMCLIIGVQPIWSGVVWGRYGGSGGSDERAAGTEDVRAAKREGVLPPFRDVPSDLGGGAGYKSHTYVSWGPGKYIRSPGKEGSCA